MRKYAVPVVIILFCTALSVLLHLKWCATPLGASESRWQEIFDYHRTFYPFSVRPLTTYSVLFFHQLTGMSLKWLFFIEQYALAAMLGLAFFRYLGKLGLSVAWTHVGVLLLMLSFPILFAHSEPIFTWDDIWGYLFLTLCCMALIDRRPLMAGLWFFGACLAREQTLLYWPILLLGLRLLSAHIGLRRTLVAAFAPVLSILIFWAVVWQSPDPTRFNLLHYNFQSEPFTVNSLFSVFISFGVLWVAWILSLAQDGKVTQPASSVRRLLDLGSIYMVAITLPLGLAFSYARETRIFFPPFVLVLPLAIVWMETRWRWMQDQAPRRKALLAAVSLVLAIGGIFAGKYIFPEFDYRRCDNFCQAWAGLHIGLIIIVLVIALLTAGRSNSASGNLGAKPS